MFAAKVVDGLDQSLVTMVGQGLGLDDAYTLDKHDSQDLSQSLNTQSLKHPIVKEDDDADIDEDYEDEMAAL